MSYERWSLPKAEDLIPAESGSDEEEAECPECGADLDHDDEGYYCPLCGWEE